jgi:type I restriction enzyme, S subunit
MTSLPPGWVEATIADLATYVQRGKSPKYADASDLPVVNQKCVRWWGIDEEHVKFVHPNQRNAWSAERFLRPGDLLWNSTGTGTIGRAALFQGSSRFEQMVVDSHVTIVRTTGYEPKLLHNWIASPAIQGQIHRMHNGSTNQVELSRGQVLGTKVPVPPLNEQRRIVDKIEALNAKSRRAKEALDAIPPLLEKFRQSILAAAFRGDLTADWRVKNPDVDPASKLLERIRTERRRRWEEAELEKLRAKGTPPKDDRWKAKYKEPAPVDTGGLPELPDGWVWSSIGECAPLQAGFAFPSKGFARTGVRLLKGNNVRDGWLNEIEIDYWPNDDAAPYSEYVLHDGDVVLAMDRPVYSSGSRATKVARLTADWNGALLLQRVGRFQPVPSVRGDYLYSLVRSTAFREHIVKEQNGSQDGKDLPHVSAGVVDSMILPIGPFDEQAMVARRLTNAEALIKSLALKVSDALRQLPCLESQVLAKAFSGGLVPQDPSDEPASVLLERIRAERGGPVPASSQRVGRRRSPKRQAAE